MHRYILSLGTDTGERLNNLSRAVLLLSRRGVHLATSSVYETSPVDMESEALFLNCATWFRTYLNPEQMLDFCQYIESQMGRKQTARNQPRIMDIDIILWSGGQYRDGRLEIPHPRATERRFVTEPVEEIYPGAFEGKHAIAAVKKTKKDTTQTIERFCGSEILFLFTPDQI